MMMHHHHDIFHAHRRRRLVEYGIVGIVAGILLLPPLFEAHVIRPSLGIDMMCRPRARIDIASARLSQAMHRGFLMGK